MNDVIIIKKYYEDLWLNLEVQEYINNHFDKMTEKGYQVSPEGTGLVLTTSHQNDMGVILNSDLFQDLILWIKEQVKQAYPKLYDREINDVYFMKVWSNKMYKQSSGDWHVHGNADIVGIFYLNVPENGAYLITETQNVITTNGDLVIHRGDLNHAVSEHKSDEPRIVLVFDMIGV